MSRLALFLLASATAHAAVLALIRLPGAATGGENLDVVEVSAMVRDEPAARPARPEEARGRLRPTPPPPRRARRSQLLAPSTPAEPEPSTPDPHRSASTLPADEGAAVAAPARDPGVPGPAQGPAPVGRETARQGSEEPAGGRGGPAGPGSRASSAAASCASAAAAVAARLRSNLAYPAWARQLSLSGVVRLRLRVGRDGRPRGIRVERSSGHSGLDRHASQALRSLRGIPSCPREIEVPVTFRVP